MFTNIYNHIVTDSLANNAIPDEQFSFLPKRITVWQLLAVVDDLEKALDADDSVHACFLDMAKAFDRVNSLFFFRNYAALKFMALNLTGFAATCLIEASVPQLMLFIPWHAQCLQVFL